ncbi:MAG: PKD domain-containing protein [Cyclobacteriaceae bacterium]
MDNSKSRLDSAGNYEVCANQGKVLINPIRRKPSDGKANSTFTKFVGIQAYSGGPIAPIQVDPTNIDKWYLLTDGLTSDTYEIEYDFEDPLGGKTSAFHIIHIFAQPKPKIILPDTTCVVGFVQLKGDTLPVQTPFPTYVNKWSWQLADAGSSQVQKPSVKFPTPGPKYITLTVTTNYQQCVASITDTLVIGDFPKPDFSYQDICTYDKTTFQDKTQFTSGQGTISKYDWHFGDGVSVSGAPNATIVDPTNTTDSVYHYPRHIYPSPNNYDVTMKVYTSAGCADSVTKTIFILPTQNTINVSPSSSYSQTFESNDGGWKPESLVGKQLNYSWVWKVPNGKYINNGTNSWWTGANNSSYDTLESSAINGPCFNLYTLNRPMISLDYWVNTPKSNNDGAVLQYSTDGGGTWKNVGKPLQGINWFSPALIVSNPGGQQAGLGPYGWSGPTQTRWMRGSFSLDSIPKAKRKQVRIRVAFAGDITKNIDDPYGYGGFAFDNVFVGNKTRNVLIEHFTNATLPDRKADFYYDNLYKKQVNFRNDSSDFHDLQYHVRFPQPDVFSQTGNNDPSSRALYYGIQNVPHTIMDGLSNYQNEGANLSTIDSVEIDRRALSAPQLLITNNAGTVGAIDTTNISGSYSSRSISVSFKVIADSAINYPLLGQVVLVEDSIVVSGYNQPFRNVVRKLLFGSEGIIRNDTIHKGSSRTFSKASIPIDVSITDNSNNLYLVAFVPKLHDQGDTTKYNSETQS